MTNDEEHRAFILQDIFPRPKDVLLSPPPSLGEIAANCIFLLDTSALLAPFSVGKESLEAIRKLYSELIGEDKLYVPAQAVREFARNRPLKIGELHSTIHSMLSALPHVKDFRSPLLEGTPEYEAFQASQRRLRQDLSDYKDALGAMRDVVESWNWNDPVTVLYSKVFQEELIVDHSKEKGEILEDLRRRVAHSIPPGYKDRSKDDGGIGDLVIWHTVLETGIARRSNVVLVSNDEKSDWMVRDNKQAIAVRYELVDEFFRKTDGMNFSVMTFSSFMESQGANEDTVAELERAESKVRLLGAAHRSQVSLFPDISGGIPTSKKELDELLRRISNIFEEFLDPWDPSEAKPYVADSSLERLSSLYEDSWQEIGKGLGNTGSRNHLYQMAEILKEIGRLNYFISYEEVRMKRGTTIAEIELEALCGRFLEIQSEYEQA